jgi:hypothetical protein
VLEPSISLFERPSPRGQRSPRQTRKNQVSPKYWLGRLSPEHERLAQVDLAPGYILPAEPIAPPLENAPMITKNLKKRLKRKSFRPFVLATTDGKRFHIADELSIGISKCEKGVRVGIMPEGGAIWILKPEEVV